LRGIVAGGADGKVDDDAVQVRAGRGHGDEMADDVLEDERIAQRGAGKLDGLLEQERLNARVEVGLVRRSDVISDAQRGPRGRGSLHEAKRRS